MSFVAIGRSAPASALQLELRLVFFQKFAEFIGGVEQAVPLLVVESHGKAAQAIDAYASLVGHAKFQATGAARALLFLQLGETGFEFFVGGFRHDVTSKDDVTATWVHVHDRV